MILLPYADLDRLFGPTAKVWAFLLYLRNPDLGTAWPSRAHLEEKLNLSERQVRNALFRLEKGELIGPPKKVQHMVWKFGKRLRMDSAFSKSSESLDGKIVTVYEREIRGIGIVNSKGLFVTWPEPISWNLLAFPIGKKTVQWFQQLTHIRLDDSVCVISRTYENAVDGGSHYPSDLTSVNTHAYIRICSGHYTSDEISTTCEERWPQKKRDNNPFMPPSGLLHAASLRVNPCREAWRAREARTIPGATCPCPWTPRQKRNPEAIPLARNCENHFAYPADFLFALGLENQPRRLLPSPRTTPRTARPHDAEVVIGKAPREKRAQTALRSEFMSKQGSGSARPPNASPRAKEAASTRNEPDDDNWDGPTDRLSTGAIVQHSSFFAELAGPPRPPPKTPLWHAKFISRDWVPQSPRRNPASCPPPHPINKLDVEEIPPLFVNLYVSLLSLRYAERCWFFKHGVEKSRFYPKIKEIAKCLKEEGITPAEWLKFRFHQWEIFQKKKGNAVVKGPHINYVLLPDLVRKFASWCYRETHGRFHTPILAMYTSRVFSAYLHRTTALYGELTAYAPEEITESLVKELLVKHRVPSKATMDKAVREEEEYARERYEQLLERRDAGEWIWK